MNLASLFSLALLAILIFCGVTSLLSRRHSHHNTPPRKSRFGFFRGAALGNALQQLQVIVQPQTRHVIVQMANEDADEDDSSDPDHPTDPVAHLHRQAKRIRRGEQIESITALLIKK